MWIASALAQGMHVRGRFIGMRKGLRSEGVGDSIARLFNDENEFGNVDYKILLLTAYYQPCCCNSRLYMICTIPLCISGWNHTKTSKGFLWL